MIVVYTDGSTLKNGAKDATGGFGVVVCEAEPHQDPETYKVIAAHAERAEGTTNNRMEMSAILWTLENYGASEGEFFVPIVYSDSKYSINSFTSWIYNWKANGWVRAGDKPLENKDLIMEYDRLVNSAGKRIDLRYIKGHNGAIWNEVADQLATAKITVEQVMEMYGG